jgi:poly-gamma-glutamate synthesis protein (capsule biosynthesis protein)
MLGRSVAERLSAGVWSEELVALCRGCDAVVANLECCVSDRGSPTTLIPGKPFFFRSPPEGVDALLEIGTTVAGLANNHALDFGPDALADTVAHLEGARIEPAGVERRGVLVAAGDLTLGVLAMSDHPAEYSSGIAFAELRRALPDWVRAELERLRAAADFVLAFPHWGPNMTASPARWQRRRAVELIDAGAHLVAGHSAHVFHGIERFPGGLAAYDLGDALDDYAVDGELRNDLGLLALWRPDGSPRLELVGLRLDFCHTRLATGADADWIASRLARACEELGTAVERTGEARLVVSG